MCASRAPTSSSTCLASATSARRSMPPTWPASSRCSRCCSASPLRRAPRRRRRPPARRRPVRPRHDGQRRLSNVDSSLEVDLDDGSTPGDSRRPARADDTDDATRAADDRRLDVATADARHPTSTPATTPPTTSAPTETPQTEVLPMLNGGTCLVGPPGGTGEVFARNSANVELDQQRGWSVVVSLSGAGEGAWNQLAVRVLQRARLVPQPPAGDRPRRRRAVGSRRARGVLPG